MKYLRIAIALVLIAAVSIVSIKKVSPVSWGLWGVTNTSSGLALGGYDAVSYFTRPAPAMGSDEFEFEWQDAVWQFASEENRNRFAKNPMRYAPEFGGFCTFAVSKGFTADADPQVWRVQNDRLYLFMDEKVRQQWVATIPDGSLERAYHNWATR